MTRIRAGIALWAAAMLLASCGEEVPRTEAGRSGGTFTGHACDLVTPSDLSQTFVGQLRADPGTPPGDATCTWHSIDSDRPVFSYQLRPYMQDLESGVRALVTDSAGEASVEFRQGLGEAAVWSDLGLFVSRNGRTLQVTPFDDETPRELYEELATLLLERLEHGSEAMPSEARAETPAQ